MAAFLLGWSSCGSSPTLSAKNQNEKTEAKDWTTSFDFDGDQIADTVFYEFSGGAHCCYKIGVQLSQSKQAFSFPFELDGGYIIFNLSNPENFNIKDFDGDGTPEIFAHINRYNGVDDPIPTTWTSEYGFKTNKILIKIVDGKPAISDFKLP